MEQIPVAEPEGRACAGADGNRWGTHLEPGLPGGYTDSRHQGS